MHSVRLFLSGVVLWVDAYIHTHTYIYPNARRATWTRRGRSWRRPSASTPPIPFPSSTKHVSYADVFVRVYTARGTAPRHQQALKSTQQTNAGAHRVAGTGHQDGARDAAACDRGKRIELVDNVGRVCIYVCVLLRAGTVRLDCHTRIPTLDESVVFFRGGGEQSLQTRTDPNVKIDRPNKLPPTKSTQKQMDPQYQPAYSFLANLEFKGANSLEDSKPAFDTIDKARGFHCFVFFVCVCTHTLVVMGVVVVLGLGCLCGVVSAQLNHSIPAH